jgi:hypothetical protein
MAVVEQAWEDTQGALRSIIFSLNSNATCPKMLATKTPTLMQLYKDRTGLVFPPFLLLRFRR